MMRAHACARRPSVTIFAYRTLSRFCIGSGVSGDVIATAARRWATNARMHALAVRRPAMTVLLTDGVPEPSSLYRAVAADVTSDQGSIGIGSGGLSPSA